MKHLKRGFCNCSQLTIEPKTGWFERLLLKFIPHFDIVKTIETLCPYCVFECDYCEGGNVKETVLYLRRFFIFRSKWIGKNFGDLYLHKIYRSDDDKDPHDHPWSFRTFVLKGGYTDEGWQFTDLDGKGNGYRTRMPHFDEKVSAPATRFRHRRHIHRVILTENKPAWTLVWTTGYTNDARGNADWRFITEERAVPWREYLGLDSGEEHGG